ncbi:LysR substrate-binding domain-containing protein [Pararhizobium sp. PWRC1-1]|uniref:LysR substrate-binding domain-containing protein n=1 Tax=Pararhizobium sp. PWRC1-1 TaxID=2804566 RepID=UPI003CF08A47
MARSRKGLPPLNAIRAFEVAGRQLNFRAAADELGVTQGAVAQQVRSLEEHVGQPLFHRLARGLALTSEGAIYLADVTRAFDTLAAATARFSSRPGAVTISVTPTFATKLLIPKMAELRAACPNVELRTIATEALSDFDRDDVDIAVRIVRPPFPDFLESVLLFRHELVIVASPLLVAGAELPMSLDQVGRFPLLHDAYDHWHALFDSGNMPFGAKFNRTTLALDAAMAGQGIALACKPFVAPDLEAGRLVQVTDDTFLVKPDYYLVRKRSAYPGRYADLVWKWCVAQWGTTEARA